MNLNPNKWSCMPTSLSNVIGMPVLDFIEKIGHDGSSFPYPGSDRRRGFCMEECLDVLSDLGYAATPILFDPWAIQAEGEPGFRLYEDGFQRVRHHMNNSDGVLVGVLDDRGHCVSWFEGLIHDPRGCGRVYPAHEMGANGFEPHTFYKIQRVR